MTTTSQEVSKNVFLNVKKMETNAADGAHTIYIYTADVKEVSIVDIQLDFTEGFNIQVENSQDMKAEVTINPMCSDTVCVVRAYDETWANPCKINISKRSPPLEEQRTYIKGSIIQLEREVQKQQLFWKDFPLKVSTVEQIKEKLLTLGSSANYIDTEFPPLDQSIQDPAKGQAFDRLVHWRRPCEFMEVDPSKDLLEPQVFAKIEPNDIIQGSLADCWFLCAVSSLAERPALVERIFLTKEYNEQGIYQLRVCKNGEWQNVIVDDYFPCFPNGGPMFSKSNGNEIWVLLLEKAFAKVHGGYKTLTGGQPYEAMMDLTGTPTMSLSFKDESVKEQVQSGKLWDLIKHFDDEGYIMAGGTPGEEMWADQKDKEKEKEEEEEEVKGNGLIPGHAYSVIAAKEAAGHKLLMLRNPWGGFEWDGDWSDESPLWTQEMLDIVKPSFDADDGTFWMCLKDFVENFETLDVTRVRNWDEVRIRGRFVRFQDANNPTLEVVQSKWIYALDVPKKSHVIVTIYQEDQRIEGILPKRPYLDMGLAVLKMDKLQGSELMLHKDYMIQRSLEIEMVLEPGQYMIVPRTTGCNLQRPDNVQPDQINLMDQQGNFHPTFTSTITDIFNKFDLVISNSIDHKEFKGFFEIIGKTALNEKDFQAQILSKYNSIDNALTLKGFKDWWRTQIIAEGEATIWTWLEKMGYDRDLYSVRSRVFTMTFHSRSLEGEDHIEVRVRDAIGTDIDNRTNEMILEKHGEEEATGEGYKVIKYFSKPSLAFTYGIKNTGALSIEATIDLSTSENLSVSSKSGIVKKTIKANEMEFMIHSQPGFGSYNSVVNHSAIELAGKK